MTLYQFQLLTKRNRLKAIVDNGVAIGGRSTIFYAIDLYQIEDFYVEVFYDKETTAIISIKSFIATSRLTPYLNQIRISF